MLAFPIRTHLCRKPGHPRSSRLQRSLFDATKLTGFFFDLLVQLDNIRNRRRGQRQQRQPQQGRDDGHDNNHNNGRDNDRDNDGCDGRNNDGRIRRAEPTMAIYARLYCH
jgi:hypothetical protein